MAFYDAVNAFINPLIGPLKILGPFYVVLLISFLVSIIVTVIYKYTTNQELMKSLKEDMKKHQDEMKKLKDNPSGCFTKLRKKRRI